MTYVFKWFVLSWLNKKQWCIQGCFITVDILFCLGWTRNIILWCIQDCFITVNILFCLGWTRNIILWCIQGCFITVDILFVLAEQKTLFCDVFRAVLSLLTMWNLWTGLGCILLILQHHWVWEMPSWLLSYQFQ